MSTQPIVKRMSSAADIEATFAVMYQLRPHLVRAEYVDTVTSMMSSGFNLAAVLVGADVVAVAGYRFGRSLSWGPYLYVDDLVTAETDRSRAHGKRLLDWLKAEARARGCGQLHLDSGVQRHGAHRFYLRERMDIIAYHFKIAVETSS